MAGEGEGKERSGGLARQGKQEKGRKKLGVSSLKCSKFGSWRKRGERVTVAMTDFPSKKH